MSFLVDQKQATPPLDVERKAVPVKWWAGLGVGFIAMALFVFIAWIFFGNPTRTPTGPTPVPGWMVVVVRAHEILGIPAALACVYWFLLRPWRRDGRISPDGLLLLAFATMYWQDPLSNMFKINFIFNSAFVQLGSWVNFIPGWLVPRGQRYPEPILWAGPMYLYFFLPPIILVNHVMRRAKLRRPQLGKVGLVFIAFVFLALCDLLAELVYLRLGVYSYVSAISWLSIFPGKYYQFPVYEAVLLGVCWAGFAALRFFRDDKGRTVAERGLDRVQVPPRLRTGLRFLALAGFVNAVLLVNNLATGLVTLNTGKWADDVLNRSYFLGGLCGPGTDMACPSIGLPIPHDKSAYITPEGKLVWPEGTKLTGQTPSP